MVFRQAGPDDAQAVLALYGSVIGTPYCVWDGSYPGEEEISGDLSAGCLYVLEDAGEIVGTVSIAPANETDGFG
ncbi:MAG: hypothetical protein IKX84_08280, partial [Clostridia bacterium]|nr:hypothetical protein [Clostridia bacterium]